MPAILLCVQAAVPNSSTASSRVNFNSQVEMTKVVKRVKQENTAIPSLIAQQDASQMAYIDAEVRPRFLQHGFNDEQISKIHELALADFHRTNPDIHIDPGEYKASVEDFGGIKISTNPAGAAVRIDDKQWQDPTNTGAMTHSGSRTVVLKKTGYRPVSRTVTVPAGDWVSMEATLEKE